MATTRHGASRGRASWTPARILPASSPRAEASSQHGALRAGQSSRRCSGGSRSPWSPSPGRTRAAAHSARLSHGRHALSFNFVGGALAFPHGAVRFRRQVGPDPAAPAGGDDAAPGAGHRACCSIPILSVGEARLYQWAAYHHDAGRRGRIPRGFPQRHTSRQLCINAKHVHAERRDRGLVIQAICLFLVLWPAVITFILNKWSLDRDSGSQRGHRWQLRPLAECLFENLSGPAIDPRSTSSCDDRFRHRLHQVARCHLVLVHVTACSSSLRRVMPCWRSACLR